MHIEELTQDYRDRLALSRSVSASKYHGLLKRFNGDVARVLYEIDNVGSGEYKSRGVIKKESLDAELEDMKRQDVELVFYGDADYPSGLMQLADAPAVLSLKGKMQLLTRGGVCGANNQCSKNADKRNSKDACSYVDYVDGRNGYIHSMGAMIAIVGARRATLASRTLAKKLAYDLGQAGQVVVSGLAAGIDAQAHLGSLYTGTIGVLGCGLNIVYPMENAELYEEIAKHGLLVSEYGMNQPVRRDSFPQRNRIIAGLCWGCVVVEAKSNDGGGMGSGSLITAKYAVELGKEVFAVPGHPLDAHASGCNALIKEGAILTEKAEDILSEYERLGGLSKGVKSCKLADRYSGNTAHVREMQMDEKNKLYIEDSVVEDDDAMIDMIDLNMSMREKIMELVSSTGVNINDIQKEMKCSINDLRAIVMELEMDEKIYMDSNDYVYRIARGE